MSLKILNGVTLSVPLPIASGGTGAVTAALGLANLGGAPRALTSGSADPTSTNLPTGQWVVWTNTTTGRTSLWANPSGTPVDLLAATTY